MLNEIVAQPGLAKNISALNLNMSRSSNIPTAISISLFYLLFRSIPDFHLRCTSSLFGELQELKWSDWQMLIS